MVASSWSQWVRHCIYYCHILSFILSKSALTLNGSLPKRTGKMQRKRKSPPTSRAKTMIPQIRTPLKRILVCMRKKWTKCVVYCILMEVCQRRIMIVISILIYRVGGYYFGSVDQERCAKSPSLIWSDFDVMLSRYSIQRHARNINGRYAGSRITTV